MRGRSRELLDTDWRANDRRPEFRLASSFPAAPGGRTDHPLNAITLAQQAN